jgi:hypothetical protein
MSRARREVGGMVRDNRNSTNKRPSTTTPGALEDREGALIPDVEIDGYSVTQVLSPESVSFLLKWEVRVRFSGQPVF